ncbi:alpha/beta fold hydrolase [Geminocystis herdmanii]|uniref:alpha/beta fold hydrolase n=1 Tax=Geminocystis herdmanii TaxID=669359 RepID=UPI00035D7854|nr:alpha/beta fold hydrolase [Geminocystis herdmanii]
MIYSGNERDWMWRGWHIHYSFARVASENQSRDIPIILLHGFGASLGHWRHNTSVLSQYHTVYALDLLGFGSSKKAYTNYGIELWTELVADFWHTFINQPCIIIGNSIGSLIALNTVAQNPHIATKLVMVSLPDVSSRQKMIPSALQPLVKTLENLVASPLLIRLLFYVVRQPNIIRRSLKVAYIDHTNVDDELVNFISSPTFDRGSARALIALSKTMGDFSTSVEELLKRVDIPMLLLWGKLDRLIPPIQAEKLAQINPNIELQLLDNLGHCIHDESPELFNNIVLNFLSSKR